MHQTMSGFFSKWNIAGAKKSWKTCPDCAATLKYNQEENTFHLKIQHAIPANLINKGSKNYVFKRETNGNFHMDWASSASVQVIQHKATLHRSISHNSHSWMALS